MFLNLGEVKTHLLVDNTLDDLYLSGLTLTCEYVIFNALRVPLVTTTGTTTHSMSGYTSTTLPLPIKHAILLLIGNLYNNREPISFAANYKVPYTIDYLLQPYIYYP